MTKSVTSGRDPALETFVAECAELLGVMEGVLLQCEQGSSGEEAVNELFRAAHTVKGSAGLFGLDAIVAFTHVVESVLDRARAGRLPISAVAAAILLQCTDHIGQLVASVAAGEEADDTTLLASGSKLLERLVQETGYAPARKASSAVPALAQQIRSDVGNIDGGPRAANAGWHISVRFSDYVLKNGMDPLSFIRYLATLGEVTGISIVDDALPAITGFDAECCYLGFEIAFNSEADQSRIEAAFEFVRDDCSLRVLPPRSLLGDFNALVRERPESFARVMELLVQCGTMSSREVDDCLALAAVPVDQAASAPVQEETSRTAKGGKSNEHRSIRVDGDKLDRLIDWIGEFIIAGAATCSIAREAGLPALQESALELARIVGEIRDQALKLRMVQIGSAFSRFQRIVRDVAHETGKNIGLEVSGSETELDRTLVEGIADPLTHLVRNAIDHGIESPEVRQLRGKPAAGVVRLNAYHDAGSVVIEVSDDGGGLKRERILQKAVERGLISADQVLTDDQVYALIFEPGFSTAEQVTNLSGRGVGMDVVKRNITALRGTVEVHSEPGNGTRVCIRLPLTLAIIDGFQVAVGPSQFVIPLDLIEECVELQKGGADAVDAAAGHIALHGSVLPLIRLRDLFEIQQTAGRRQSVVVVRSAGRRVGIVVDELHGELQAVIKPLSKLFSQLQGIGGSTILGTGRVALILDIPGLVERRHAMGHGRGEAPRSRIPVDLVDP